MKIRWMQTRDRHSVFNIAVQLAATMYPQLKVDIAKVNHQLENCGQFEYAKVAVDDSDEVQGCLLARTAPNLWAQRNHAAIVLWYSVLPGGGAALLRDFRDWIGESRKIRLAGFSHDSDAMDPRALRLAERVGFKRHGGAYMLYN